MTVKVFCIFLYMYCDTYIKQIVLILCVSCFNNVSNSIPSDLNVLFKIIGLQNSDIYFFSPFFHFCCMALYDCNSAYEFSNVNPVFRNHLRCHLD